MASTVLRDPRFDREFLELSKGTREACWRVIAAVRRRPRTSGAGFRVERLRQLAPTEGWAAHFDGDRYRLLYVLDGEVVILIGVGARPGFYRRLDRLRGRAQSD